MPEPITIAHAGDWHLEFVDYAYPKPEVAAADLSVLAGDIGVGVMGLEWAAGNLPRPLVYVAGNHEFYDGDINSIRDQLRIFADGEQGVFYLDDDVLVLEIKGRQLRVLGSMLWSDFQINGDARTAMEESGRQMNDYRLILNGGRLLSPTDTLKIHAASRKWLEGELAGDFEGTTVVATHFAPSARSLDPKYRGDELNGAFASDLEGLIEGCGPELWIHGHTHHDVDYMIGKTRIAAHQRGYENQDFQPAVIEI